MTSAAVRRFNSDVKRLDKSKTELKSDKKDLKKDQAELTKDRGAVTTLKHQKADALARIEQERQNVIAANPLLDPTNPILSMQLAGLDQQKRDTTKSFDERIAAKAKEVTHDTRVVSHDHRELKADAKAVKKHTHTARAHLKAAELRSDTVRGTNRMRHAVGLAPVDHLIGDTKTVAGCARLLLNSPNVSFWSGLSTGSDRKNLVLLATHHAARVDGTNTSIRHATPKLSMMQALVDMSRHGHIQINALTGGTHSPNSNHYHGTAVDLALVNTGMVTSIAARHGGFRNSETDHIHLDF
ncbi:MAG: hypothetical protein IPJ65_39265 [Archangiaceae bacterium]|nr:hypothetical protein [Archangiaceae bacterium]